ncbi:DNA cytosine methyltransferase [Candidatus Omnitrophota bacterium]
MKVIDLFAGVGGLSEGFRQAGFEIALANDIDKQIASSYSLNHAKTKVINEDITALNISSVFAKYKSKVDIVVGGPPCQGFSQKGQRKTINDDRNFLFKYFYRVIDKIRPKYILMENVPNLLTIENGYFKDEIVALFEKLGYALDAQVLNTVDFGVPQIRRRAFILGKLSKNPLRLPKGKIKQVTVRDAISDLAYLSSGEGIETQKYTNKIQSQYQGLMREGSKLLHNHVATRHSKLALKRLSLIPVGKGKEVLPKEHLTKSIYSGTWCRMLWNEPSVTITTRFDTPSSGRFTHPVLNRAITVREAARIQSFPDTFIFYGIKTSQMKQVGNAVPPLLAKAIAEVIKRDIK